MPPLPGRAAGRTSRVVSYPRSRQTRLRRCFQTDCIDFTVWYIRILVMCTFSVCSDSMGTPDVGPSGHLHNNTWDLGRYGYNINHVVFSWLLFPPLTEWYWCIDFICRIRRLQTLTTDQTWSNNSVSCSSIGSNGAHSQHASRKASTPSLRLFLSTPPSSSVGGAVRPSGAVWARSFVIVVIFISAPSLPVTLPQPPASFFFFFFLLLVPLVFSTHQIAMDTVHLVIRRIYNVHNERGHSCVGKTETMDDDGRWFRTLVIKIKNRIEQNTLLLFKRWDKWLYFTLNKRSDTENRTMRSFQSSERTMAAVIVTVGTQLPWLQGTAVKSWCYILLHFGNEFFFGAEQIFLKSISLSLWDDSSVVLTDTDTHPGGLFGAVGVWDKRGHPGPWSLLSSCSSIFYGSV